MVDGGLCVLVAGAPMRVIRTIDTKSRVSISHWGMFEVALPRIIVSAAMAKDIEKFRSEWNKPDGFIKIRHVDE